MDVPDAVTVVVSWEKRTGIAAVMGLLDEAGRSVDVPMSMLTRLTGLLSRPVSADVIRLGFPRADLSASGAISLNIPVDETLWSRVLDKVSLEVEAGLRVSGDDVRDALWVTLEAAGLPNGSIRLERLVMFTELPDDLVFAPRVLAALSGGRGSAVGWADALGAFPVPMVAQRLGVLVNELGLREEQALRLSGSPVVLTDVTVDL